MGIRFHNNKEWFDENRQLYKQYVHEPMVLFANELYGMFQAFDKSFCDEPKICRANRDIRFSKNKLPYKESKWFFLRTNKIARIRYEKPNYFFEITPDGYRYGLGFWPSPATMVKYRKKIEKNPSEAEGIVELFSRQTVFQLSGDLYKKKFQGSPDGALHQWYIRKEITLIAEFPCDETLYDRALLSKVFQDFKAVYPIYQYLLPISSA